VPRLRCHIHLSRYGKSYRYGVDRTESTRIYGCDLSYINLRPHTDIFPCFSCFPRFYLAVDYTLAILCLCWMFAARRPKMTQFNIEVVSDTVCPWCYVGKKKLDKAIEEYKLKHPESKDTFTITWKPYFLNPSAPKIGTSSPDRGHLPHAFRRSSNQQRPWANIRLQVSQRPNTMPRNSAQRRDSRYSRA